MLLIYSFDASTGILIFHWAQKLWDISGIVHNLSSYWISSPPGTWSFLVSQFFQPLVAFSSSFSALSFDPPPLSTSQSGLQAKWLGQPACFVLSSNSLLGSEVRGPHSVLPTAPWCSALPAKGGFPSWELEPCQESTWTEKYSRQAWLNPQISLIRTFKGT